MSALWCAWCDLSSRQWAGVDQTIGEIWTKNTLSALHNKIAADTNGRMKPAEMKGVRSKVILEVDPSLFVAPPLHIKLGLVNRAFIKPDGYSYLSWSKKRIESIPAIEKIAFTLFPDAVDKLIEAEEDQLLWNIRYQEDFLAVKEHLQRVWASLKRRNLSNDEKSELKENEAIIQHEYVDLNQTRENIVKKVK